MKKIVISGTSSGVGKTTITLGIMKALKDRGMSVQPFKVGPDYIDPSYHTYVTERYSRNLDSYMLDDEKIKYIFNDASQGSDISVVEGVMGLYDGMGTDIDDCTTSHISKLLKAPVILVIDAKAMAASSAAMVLGYKNLDKDLNISGVIANNVTHESHYKLIKDSVEKYCNTEVLGYLPPNNELSLNSRHLGLVPAIELESLEKKLDILSKEINKYINLDRIVELAENEDVCSKFELDKIVKSKLNKTKVDFSNKTVAIAYDKAFNFYYRENIDLFEKVGIKVEYFSPLDDEKVPDSDYVYIGGGFPELYAEKLHQNESMRKSMLDAHKNKVPIYAECGGLMYLGSRITNLEKNEYNMVGILCGKSEMTDKLNRFGYCYGTAKMNTLLSRKGERIKGHEFHHSVFNSNEECAYTMQKANKSKSENWEGGYSKDNTLATYLHIHFYDNIDSFIRFITR